MAWRPDPLLEGFEALELEQPADYDGRVVATLVRLPASLAPHGAARGTVLYVHGFIDYFFQRHTAERFAAEGYAFYALDTRKHGRSLLPHQHPCFCKDIAEYFADIDAALREIGAPVLLAGHSTGGLVCSLYAASGEERGRVRALWLNSPFFDWRARGSQRRQVAIASFLGRFFPFLNNPRAVLPAYVRSIHRNWDGEWDFDLRLKPLMGFPAYFGWVRAICAAHARVRGGLGLGIPVLSMHSDEADIVLDWRDVARWSRALGRDVSVLAFPGGLHDLVLSRREIRDAAFAQLFSWAERGRPQG
ncbi:MAG TPA: alpha/beta hydrolase [Burkholderiales bacterium]|nr:alpha/beta hydrolase [Burkholderiales bacterium]